MKCTVITLSTHTSSIKQKPYSSALQTSLTRFAPVWYAKSQQNSIPHVYSGMSLAWDPFFAIIDYIIRQQLVCQKIAGDFSIPELQVFYLSSLVDKRDNSKSQGSSTAWSAIYQMHYSKITWNGCRKAHDWPIYSSQCSGLQRRNRGKQVIDNIFHDAVSFAQDIALGGLKKGSKTLLSSLHTHPSTVFWGTFEKISKLVRRLPGSCEKALLCGSFIQKSVSNNYSSLLSRWGLHEQADARW